MLETCPLPEEVHILFSRSIRTVLNPSVGYCSVYVDQI